MNTTLSKSPNKSYLPPPSFTSPVHLRRHPLALAVPLLEPTQKFVFRFSQSYMLITSYKPVLLRRYSLASAPLPLQNMPWFLNACGKDASKGWTHASSSVSTVPGGETEMGTASRFFSWIFGKRAACFSDTYEYMIMIHICIWYDDVWNILIKKKRVWHACLTPWMVFPLLLHLLQVSSSETANLKEN